MPSQWSTNMLKVLPCKFQQSFGAFTMLLPKKDPSKQDFFDIDLTRFFGVRKFGNTSAMRVIFFFWKCSKFKLDFKNAEKKSEKVFYFWGTFIWIGWVKLSLLRREYLLSAHSLLGNSLEILHISKKDFLRVNCLHSDQ